MKEDAGRDGDAPEKTQSKRVERQQDKAVGLPTFKPRTVCMQPLCCYCRIEAHRAAAPSKRKGHDTRTWTVASSKVPPYPLCDRSMSVLMATQQVGSLGDRQRSLLDNQPHCNVQCFSLLSRVGEEPQYRRRENSGV